MWNRLLSDSAIWGLSTFSALTLMALLFMLIPALPIHAPQTLTESNPMVVRFSQWKKRQPEPTPQPTQPKPVKPEQKTPPPVKPKPKPEPKQEQAPQPKPVERQLTLSEPPAEAEQEPSPQQPAPEPQPSAPPLPKPVPFFQLTAMPQFMHRAAPEYPQSEKNLGREALVKVEVLIDTEGKVREVTVLRSAGEKFDQAAVKAIEASTFTPGEVEGKKVAVRLRVPVRFSLR